MTVDNDLLQYAIDLYTDVARIGLPFAIAFGVGNLIVSTFLRVAFGGKLRFGSDRL